MVNLTRMRWHTLYSDIVDLHSRLNEVGCTVYNGEVTMLEKDSVLSRQKVPGIGIMVYKGLY